MYGLKYEVKSNNRTITVMFTVTKIENFQIASPTYFHPKIIFTVRNHKWLSHSTYSTRNDALNETQRRLFCAPRDLDEHLVTLSLTTISRFRSRHGHPNTSQCVSSHIYISNLPIESVKCVYDIKTYIKYVILHCLHAMIYCCPQSSAYVASPPEKENI